jgi:hypothetical protein
MSNTKDFIIHNPDNLPIQVLPNNSQLQNGSKISGKQNLQLSLPVIHRQYAIKFDHKPDEKGKLPLSLMNLNYILLIVE